MCSCRAVRVSPVLHQAAVDFSSGTWRVARSVLVSSADEEKGTPGGGKEAGVFEGPHLTALGYQPSWRLLGLPKTPVFMG